VGRSENELVYVFLSNRTYPDATTNTLSKENVREDVKGDLRIDCKITQITRISQR
jgi:hypothetical protein